MHVFLLVAPSLPSTCPSPSCAAGRKGGRDQRKAADCCVDRSRILGEADNCRTEAKLDTLCVCVCVWGGGGGGVGQSYVEYS